MSADGHGTKWHRNSTENFNRLSRAHERYLQTDGFTTTYSERDRSLKTSLNVDRPQKTVPDDLLYNITTQAVLQGHL